MIICLYNGRMKACQMDGSCINMILNTHNLQTYFVLCTYKGSSQNRNTRRAFRTTNSPDMFVAIITQAKKDCNRMSFTSAIFILFRCDPPQRCNLLPGIVFPFPSMILLILLNFAVYDVYGHMASYALAGKQAVALILTFCAVFLTDDKNTPKSAVSYV